MPISEVLELGTPPETIIEMKQFNIVMLHFEVTYRLLQYLHVIAGKVIANNNPN